VVQLHDNAELQSKQYEIIFVQRAHNDASLLINNVVSSHDTIHITLSFYPELVSESDTEKYLDRIVDICTGDIDGK